MSQSNLHFYLHNIIYILDNYIEIVTPSRQFFYIFRNFIYIFYLIYIHFIKEGFILLCDPSITISLYFLPIASISDQYSLVLPSFSFLFIPLLIRYRYRNFTCNILYLYMDILLSSFIFIYSLFYLLYIFYLYIINLYFYIYFSLCPIMI